MTDVPATPVDPDGAPVAQEVLHAHCPQEQEQEQEQELTTAAEGQEAAQQAAGVPPPKGSAGDGGGAPGDDAPPSFKTVVVKGVSAQDVDKIWRQLQFGVTPVELTQSSRQQGLLIENTLTTLAKHIRSLQNDVAQSKADVVDLQEMAGVASSSTSSASFPTAAQPAGVDAAKLQDFMSEISAATATAMAQLQQLAQELAEQKAENAKLKAEVSRLGPALSQVEASAQAAATAAVSAGGVQIDFSPVWSETHLLSARIAHLEDDSSVHSRQLEHALKLLAAEDAAEDVLATLDRSALQRVVSEGGQQVDSPEDSQLYAHVRAQAQAIGLRTLDGTASQMTGLDGAFLMHEKVDVESCFRHWKRLVRAASSSVRPPGAEPLGSFAPRDDSPGVAEATDEEVQALRADAAEKQAAVEVANAETTVAEEEYASAVAAAAAPDAPPEAVAAVQAAKAARDDVASKALEAKAEAVATAGQVQALQTDVATTQAAAESTPSAETTVAVEKYQAPPVSAAATASTAAPDSATNPTAVSGDLAMAAQSGSAGGTVSEKEARRAISRDAKAKVHRSRSSSPGRGMVTQQRGGGAAGGGAQAQAAARERATMVMGNAVDGRLDRKMNDKIEKMQMRQDMDQMALTLRQIEAKVDDVSGGSTFESFQDHIRELQSQNKALQAAVDGIGRAAADAASKATDAVSGMGQLTGGMEDFGKLRQDVVALMTEWPGLGKLQASVDTMASDWSDAHGQLQRQLKPLLVLPKTIATVEQQLRHELQSKAADGELGRAQVSIEEIQLQLKSLESRLPTAASLPPEVQDMLTQLGTIKDMKGTLVQHAKKLADLFNKKASLDDIQQATSMMKNLDHKLASEVDQRAASIMGEFDSSRSEWQSKLGALSKEINEKADEAWMRTLEEQIREEMAVLRKKGGGKGISAQALEGKLKALRQKITEVGGLTETGSALFRCIACDRPLPTTSEWRKPAGTSHSDLFPGEKPRKLKENHADVIMKGGFPMSNPKVKPSDRQQTQRAFGKNSTAVEDAQLAGRGTSPASGGVGDKGARLSAAGGVTPPPQSPTQLPPLSSAPTVGGSSQGAIGVEGSWPPPSVPHFDAW